MNTVNPSPRPPRLEDPFQASWRQEFWYNESVREKRLNLLLHLAPYSAVLLLTGDEGSGKTTLIQQFLARAHDTWRICHIQGATDVDDLGLLDRLDEELSLRGDPQADLEARIASLRDSLHALRRGSLIPIAVVDDAHLLPQAALTMLGRLTEPRDDGELLLCAILCGEPSIEERFSMPGLGTLRERVSHSFDLLPLGEEGVAEYIRHRMRVAGHEVDGPFTPAVLKFIHVASRGLPGRINELARGVLRNDGQQAVSGDALAPRASAGRTLLRYGLAALAISLVVVALFYQDTLKEYATVDPLPAFETVVEAPALTPPAALPEPAPEADEPVADAAATEEAPLVVDDGDRAADAPSTTVAGSAESPSAVTAGSAAVARAPVEAPPPEPAPVERPAPEPTSAPDPLPAPGQRDAAWLRAQPPGHFTLQLFASSEERVRAFVERHGLGAEAVLFRSTAAGDRPLYSVVYGLYPNRQAAVQAGREAPVAAIDGVEPWVRSLRDIHAVIDRVGADPQ